MYQVVIQHRVLGNILDPRTVSQGVTHHYKIIVSGHFLDVCIRTITVTGLRDGYR